MDKHNDALDAFSRRDFLKTSATTAATAALMASGGYAFAAGSDRLRVGVVGCGGRGTGAALQSLIGSPNMELWAMGDLFQDRLEGSYANLKDAVNDADRVKADPTLPGKLKVDPERRFVGFDAYQKVIGSGVDLVILASPPGFRPTHLQAAVEAGKHVFMEKPVAVDGPGIRSVIASADVARQKGLGIVAGTQRRHQFPYLETIKRIHHGAIGQVVAAQCYWNQGGLWLHPRQDAWTDMEYQVRNWLYYTWLSGDHIVEQHVHNLDVINWVLGEHPARCVGMGGRQVRTDPAYGHIFDHFTVEYEYGSGARLMSMCRQIVGCESNVSEHVIGTRGSANPGGSITTRSTWNYAGPKNDPYVTEHTDLVASIRAGKPLNEGRQVAESVLTAIMGRMSAYTGKAVTWEQALNSQESLVPARLEFGPLPVPPVAVPGKTPLI